MSETLLLSASIFSLLLTIAYGLAKKQSRVASELKSAQNVKTLAALIIPKTSSMDEVLRKILAALAMSYNSKKGTIEFHGKICDDFSFSIDEKSELEKSKTEPTPADKGIHRLAFAIYDENFTCRIELYAATVPSHDECWHIQELIKEKLSLYVLANQASSDHIGIAKGEALSHLLSAHEEFPGTNQEVQDLMFTVMDDLNFGVVVLSKDANCEQSEFKVYNINKAFYRIFGLDGSNAQTDEVNEILSTAIKPDGMTAFSGNSSHAGTEFFYMRHDGLKVRTKLILFENQNGARIVVFEPVENVRLLMSSYSRLLNAAGHLFKSGEIRSYLKEILDSTQSDGVAIVKKAAKTSSFDIAEKAGFIINVPRFPFEDLLSREFVSSQGYLVIPMREEAEVTGALVALKPSEDAIEIALAGARVLEVYDVAQKGLHDLHFKNAKLQMEAKRADVANSSKSEFLANMSHEIRTPLNSVIGFADILHEESGELSSDIVREFSGNIVSAGKYLLSLINDILDLAKVETGKMKLNLQEFSLYEMVESVERTLKPLLGLSKVKFDFHLQKNLDIFFADSVKFKQILYNLLSNAIKHSPTGSCVKLEIAKSTDGIELKVIDKGTGIKKEDYDKLFKPFIQLGASDGGTGLGLALTKKLVEIHGGSIWIDSTFGSGTEVTVYLPNLPLPHNPEIIDAHDISDGTTKVIFVTNDNKLHQLFTMVVEGTGLDVTRFSPNKIDQIITREAKEFVLVIDALPENLNEEVLSVCRSAGRILLLAETENVKAAWDLLKDYEDTISVVDRRNFTKSELLAELNIARSSQMGV